MSDPIAQAAADMAAAPSSTEPHTDAQAAQGEAGKPQESASTEKSSESPVTTAPQTENVLVNGGAELVDVAAPELDQSIASTASAGSSQASGEVAELLPRESHLMLLEHKLAAMHAKFKTGERIMIDEFEQILGHIMAVL